jgi:hypothetical protein
MLFPSQAEMPYRDFIQCQYCALDGRSLIIPLDNSINGYAVHEAYKHQHVMGVFEIPAIKVSPSQPRRIFRAFPEHTVSVDTSFQEIKFENFDFDMLVASSLVKIQGNPQGEYATICSFHQNGKFYCEWPGESWKETRSYCPDCLLAIKTNFCSEDFILKTIFEAVDNGVAQQAIFMSQELRKELVRRSNENYSHDEKLMALDENPFVVEPTQLAVESTFEQIEKFLQDDK